MRDVVFHEIRLRAMAKQSNAVIVVFAVVIAIALWFRLAIRLRQSGSVVPVEYEVSECDLNDTPLTRYAG